MGIWVEMRPLLSSYPMGRSRSSKLRSASHLKPLMRSCKATLVSCKPLVCRAWMTLRLWTVETSLKAMAQMVLLRLGWEARTLSAVWGDNGGEVGTMLAATGLNGIGKMGVWGGVVARDSSDALTE